MTGYTKLFKSLVTSSIWQETDETRIIWITMLALADKDGKVDASVPGLANVAKVSMEKTISALAVLESPDQYSRSSEFEGRRVEKCEGGWKILNHAKYRNKLSTSERREYHRIKQAEYRQRKKKAGPLPFEQSALKALAAGHEKGFDYLAAQRNGQ